MDCTTALFFHWLWKGEQRIPLTSEEVRSMGSLGFFFFLTWEESKSTSEKSCLDLAGYHWTQETDNGKEGWGQSLFKQRRWSCRGGAGGLFYGAGHMPSRVTLCKTLGVLICLDQNTRGTGEGMVCAICDHWVLRKPGFAITIICCW